MKIEAGKSSTEGMATRDHRDHKDFSSGGRDAPETRRRDARATLLQAVLRHRAWIMVALIIVVAFAIRARLRAMPLERDEGEYAYAGQLILQGVPPYKLAYNMKLPGTYAAYALLMAVFGQSASGIHVGLGLVNGASIALMFLIGRRLMDETAGVTA